MFPLLMNSMCSYADLSKSERKKIFSEYMDELARRMEAKTKSMKSFLGASTPQPLSGQDPNGLILERTDCRMKMEDDKEVDADSECSDGSESDGDHEDVRGNSASKERHNRKRERESPDAGKERKSRKHKKERKHKKVGGDSDYPVKQITYPFNSAQKGIGLAARSSC